MLTDQEFKPLDEFINRTDHLLAFLVSVRAGYVPEHLHEFLVKSWPQVLEALRGMHGEIRNSDSEQLGKVGMSGMQLGLKMESFKFAQQTLESAMEKTPLMPIYVAAGKDPYHTPTEEPVKLGRLLKGIVKKLIAVLKFVNSTFASLGQVTGFSEMVKEFKEVLENLLYTKEAVDED